MLRVVLLLEALSTVCHSQLRLVSLNDLWTSKFLSGEALTNNMIPSLGHHLFPTHESTLYPQFLAIPSSGYSTIHASSDTVKQLSRTRTIHSVCSYRYVNITYFVINEEPYPGFSELAINATFEELQGKANAMTFQLMKPSYFCFDPHHKTFK